MTIRQTLQLTIAFTFVIIAASCTILPNRLNAKDGFDYDANFTILQINDAPGSIWGQIFIFDKQ